MPQQPSSNASNRTVDRKAGRPRVAVIGAGVCGLGIGWKLAAAGCSVDIFDRGAPGRGASWAAAGMLAAQAEAEPGEEKLLRLNLKSQAMWLSFARAVEAVSGIDIGYRDEGTLIVALNRDDAAALEFTHDLQRRLGLDTRWLSGSEARRIEPFLAPSVTAAILSPADHQVDNRQLVLALQAGCETFGARVHPKTEVTAIDVTEGRVRGIVVRQDNETFHAADTVVVAAGAWSRSLPGLPAEIRPPVRPVKGQMMALRMDPAAPLLTHVLWGPGVYLVPRGDGRLLIGATVEEKGFDDTLTAGGVLELLRESWEVLPGIEELAIDEMWVGHRPTSRDDAPILGPTSIDGLVMATGHHRNGILLTPITVEAVAAYILTGELDEAIGPFGLDRFGTRPKRRPDRDPQGAKLGVVS